MRLLIHGGSKEGHNASNNSDPSAVTECMDSPTMGGLDLNLPAPDTGRDECDRSRKTL